MGLKTWAGLAVVLTRATVVTSPLGGCAESIGFKSANLKGPFATIGCPSYLRLRSVTVAGNAAPDASGSGESGA